MGKKLIVEPTECLIVDDISIKIKNLNRHEIVELHAEMTDNFGERWSSSVMVQANASGNVDMEAANPLMGSYSTSSKMGLFWSMKRESLGNGAKTPRKPIKTNITLIQNGTIHETIQVVRHLAHPSLIREKVNENGLVGVFYNHGDSQKRPTLLVLGGSEGGLKEGQAALLAAQGFNALSLAYFGIPGLPSQLVNIPLEYFQKAMDWLEQHPSVDSKRLGVVGTSKGGELALLLASYFSNLKTVIAIAPSSVIHMGLGDTTDGMPPSSWSLLGKPFPYAFNDQKAKELNLALSKQRKAHEPLSFREWYRVHAEAAINQSIIPVEMINGSVLVISGGDDQLWPSDFFCEQIINRLRKNHFPYMYRHLNYPKAGHAIVFPGMPTTESANFGYGAFKLAAGGTPEENYKAQKESWIHMISFLKEYL